MADKGKKKGGTVIPLKNKKKPEAGAPEGTEFSSRMALLRGKDPKEMIRLILEDPQGREAARSLKPQEIYRLVKELGPGDSLPMIRLSSAEQCGFFLDMELWDKWSFCPDKAMEWLETLMAAGEERMAEQLKALDFELLLLLCMTEVIVGGGIGDMLSDGERKAEWDHTFDDVFFITFRNDEHAPLMGRFLDLVFRTDHELYLRLMEGVKNEIESEVEELCFRFRSGRLADLGFPELEDALALYGYLDPDTFSPASDKVPICLDGDANLMLPLQPGESLLQQALARAASEGLYAEINFLINASLVAEQSPFADRESLEEILGRVYGYLNIALERLSGGDLERAEAILAGEYLKQLFRLGFSIISELGKRAARLPEAGSHAANRAILGLRRKCPRFYRGLDPDHADGYREFRDMADVGLADAFLRELGV